MRGIDFLEGFRDCVFAGYLAYAGIIPVVLSCCAIARLAGMTGHGPGTICRSGLAE